MSANSLSTSARAPVKRTTVWILAAAIILPALNWIAAVARFQVNVPIWDQWNFFGPLFESRGWWDLFNFQHGPHRLGPGSILESWVMGSSHWDTRIESIWIVSLLVLSAVLALRLKWKLSGRLSSADAAIPIIVLSLSQWGSVIAVPIAVHSVFPLFLLFAACNTWLTDSPYIRFLLTGALAIALTFSGFGLFAGGLITLLISVSLVKLATRPKNLPALIPAAIALLLALTGWITFAHGYRFDPASEGYHFPHEPLFDYARFLTLMFAFPLGRDSITSFSYIAGTVLLAGSTLIAGTAAWTWIRKSSEDTRQQEIPLLLIVSSLAFAAFVAIGRIHLGLTAGMASRYITLLIPLWLGIYFWSTQHIRPSLRQTAPILLWLIALLPLSHLPSRPFNSWPGTVGLSDVGLRDLADSANQKIAWVSAFQRTGDFQQADSSVGRLIHPAGESVALGRRLAWLKARNFSFFAPSSHPGAWQPWWPENRTVWLRTHDPEGHERWMADDCTLWIQSTHDGFINFQVCHSALHLPADSQIEIGHQNITAREPAGFLHDTISLPITKGEQILNLRSTRGSVVANPPHDNRLISFRLTDAWITRQPAGVEWITIGSTSTGQTWAPRYRWQIVSGFHGWEHPAHFGWSDARLKLEIDSANPVFLNVHIDKRYRPVDHGPILLRQQDRTIEVSSAASPLSFSIPIPGSPARQSVELENPAGASSPHSTEGKSDTRRLAIRFSHLSVSTTPVFPILPDTR